VREARQDERQLDAGAAQLGTDRLGEPGHGVLARRVDRLARHADAGRRGGDVHDVAGAAGDHRRQRQLHAQRDAARVDRELARGPRVVLLEEGTDVHDAGVVDQHVQPAEPSLGGGEERGERVAAGDVEVAARAADLVARGGGKVAVEVADGHPRATPGQLAGGRQADAPCPAGDGHHAAGDGTGGAAHGA
jgi:hypothetical protein